MRSQSTHQLTYSLTRALHNPYVHRKVEFALRVAVFSALPCGLCAYHPTMRHVFATRTMVPLLTVILGRETLGEGHFVLIEILKALVVSLPFSILACVLQVYCSTVAWALTYFLFLNILGMVAEPFPRKMAFVFLTASMLAQRDDTGRTPIYPLKVALDALIGCCFGMLTCVLPFPRKAVRDAHEQCALAVRELAQCFVIISTSFWCE